MAMHPKKHIFYSANDKPPSENVFRVPMQPGDALIFDGDLLHYTPPNRTGRRRRALQFHYASAACAPSMCTNATKEGVEKVLAPNPVYGKVPTPVSSHYDCAPTAEVCIEPQYWYYRQAEMVACGERKHPGSI